MEKTIYNKELILKDAFILFLQRGYKSVSIKDIMESSQLSKGAIYHHFESKEVIFFEALEKFYFQNLTLEKSDFEGISFEKQVEKLYFFAIDLYTMIENLEDGIDFPIRCFYQFQLECENFESIREKFKAVANSYRIFTKNLVSEAISNKVLKPDLDADLISYQIVGMIEGIAIHHSTLKNNVKSILEAKYEKIFKAYLELISISKVNMLILSN